MPLLSIVEIKFVPPTWDGDSRGYTHETVHDANVIAAWKRYFDEELRLAKEAAKLCADDHVCERKYAAEGEHECEYRVRRIKEDMYTPRKPQLVKIAIPTKITIPTTESSASSRSAPDQSPLPHQEDTDQTS